MPQQNPAYQPAHSPTDPAQYPEPMAQTQSPGWYPAPDGNGQQWWNGAGWSESRRGAAASPTPAASVAPPPVYSPGNPAPQRPDPYGSPITLQGAMPARPTALNLSQNRHATIGFVLGLVSAFALGIAAPVGIVFSVLGIQQARRLGAQGVANTGMVFAVIGLLTSGVALVILLVQVIFFIATFASVTTDFGAGGVPGFGVLSYLFGR